MKHQNLKVHQLIYGELIRNFYTHMNHHTSCLSEKLFCLRELCSDFVLFFLASLCYLVSVACNVLEREMGLFNTLVTL